MSTLTVLADIGGRGVVVGFLLPIAIVALVAYGVFELVRSRQAAPAPAGGAGPWPTAPTPPASASALGILDERFARGEIDAEEYVQRRSLLVPPSAPAWPAAAAEPPTATTPAVDAAPTGDAAPTAESPAGDAEHGTA